MVKKHMAVLLFALLGLMAIYVVQTSATQAKNVTPPGSVNQSIEKYATQLLKDQRFSSVAIGVYHKGKTYKGYFGELTHGKNNPPNDKTLFEIASVGKTITGLVAATAVLEGRLALDVDINRYLPVPLLNLSPAEQPVTLRQLLTHTSGIPANIADLAAVTNTENLNRETFVQALNNPNLKMKRGEYLYSNLAPNFLAYLLESVYQKPFEALVQQAVSPLGMKNTKITLEEDDLPHFAYGYNDKGESMPAFTDAAGLWGAGGRIKATLPDLLHYLTFQLAQNNPLVKESQKTLLDNGGYYDISYYWQSNNDNDGKYFQHHGGLYGTQNWFIFYPEDQIGISVIANSSFNTAGNLLRDVSDAIFDEIKSRGKKSIRLAIQAQCFKDSGKCIEQYLSLKKNHRDSYYFADENQLNVLGYRLLSENEVDKAIDLFTLLTHEFPQSANAYDSLAEAYYNHQDYVRSRLYYQKSFAMNNKNRHAKTMIEKINRKLK